MDRNQIKNAFYDKDKPLMKNYLLILVALLLLVVLFFVFTDYQAISQIISDGEAPPALPSTPDAGGTVLENSQPPDFPSLPVS